MIVHVVCFGAMRDYLPPGSSGNRVALEVEPESRVGDVVDRLGAPRHLVFSLLLDGVHADLETVVTQGQEITLMPPFAGGS